MYFQTLRLAIIAAAITIATPAFAQDCGCSGGGYSYGGGQIGGDVGQLGFGFHSPNNCGRGITQQQAEGLWAGYCNENCGYTGGGSAGGGRLGGKLFGGCKSCGLSGGGCGCNSGCFGYPTGGGCGGGGGCRLGGRHGGGCGKRKGLHGSSCGGDSCGGGDCGGGGCGGGKLRGLHSGGCGGGSCGGGGKLRGLHGGGCGGGCKLFGGCKKFSSSAQQCGTSGAYFTEAVGYEYGTAGIQSCVSCNTCGSFDSLAPAMAAPIAQPMSIMGSGVIAPAAVEPVVGAIGALN